MPLERDYQFSDFTLQRYQKMVQLANERYTFCSYASFRQVERFVLWRHDIDFSPSQALKMAEIEAQEAVQATYFLHLHNDFYNLLDASTAQSVKAIIYSGHDLGLHFDCKYYSIENAKQLEELIDREKRFLEDTFSCQLTAVSFHNPTSEIVDYGQESYAGLVNTYSQYLMKEVGYCSDSNGYWRFDRLQDVLENGKDRCLQVLTHPGLWTSEEMAPRQRIEKVIQDRAQLMGRLYDNLLEECGRENVGAETTASR